LTPWGALYALKGLTLDVTARKRSEDRQTLLVADLDHQLMQRRVTVIATGGPPSVFAAKAATTTIPFVVGEDPVKLGRTATLRKVSYGRG